MWIKIFVWTVASLSYIGYKGRIFTNIYCKLIIHKAKYVQFYMRISLKNYGIRIMPLEIAFKWKVFEDFNIILQFEIEFWAEI